MPYLLTETNVLVNSKPDLSPRARPQGIFWMGKFSTPGHKESVKPLPLGKKSR